MKNILFIMYNLGGGGAEKVLVNVLNNIDYSNYNVDLLLIIEEGIYLNKINMNVKIKSVIPKKRSNNFFHLLHRYINYKLYEHFPNLLARLLIGKKYNLEIAFLEGPTSSFLSRSPNKLSKKIAWVHSDLTKHRTMPLEKEKRIYNFIDKIICVSEQGKEKLCELYPEIRNKVKVIYNLIDNNEVKSLSQSKIDYNFDDNTIVAVGRLTKAKRFDILIKAHKLLLEEGIKNRLIILGEGELRSDLQNLITQLDIEDTVSMPGFILNPYPYIKNGDIFVVSSEYEGFSLVVAEALILGKAIVSTDCTGPQELLGKGEFGILVGKNNHFEMKEQLRKLLLNNSLRKDYEKSAIKRSEVLNKESVMMKIYELFNEGDLENV